MSLTLVFTFLFKTFKILRKCSRWLLLLPVDRPSSWQCKWDFQIFSSIIQNGTIKKRFVQKILKDHFQSLFQMKTFQTLSSLSLSLYLCQDEGRVLFQIKTFNTFSSLSHDDGQVLIQMKTFHTFSSLSLSLSLYLSQDEGRMLFKIKTFNTFSSLYLDDGQVLIQMETFSIFIFIS